MILARVEGRVEAPGVAASSDISTAQRHVEHSPLHLWGTFVLAHLILRVMGLITLAAWSFWTAFVLAVRALAFSSDPRGGATVAEALDMYPEAKTDPAVGRTGPTRSVPLRGVWTAGSVVVSSAIPDRFRSTSLGVGRSPVSPELTSSSGPKLSARR
jgi:hypothetical protein